MDMRKNMPLSLQDFAWAMTAARQNVALKEEEVGKQLDAERLLFRDERRSALRREEQIFKEAGKFRIAEFVVQKDQIVKRVWSRNSVLAEEVICPWSIQKVKKYVKKNETYDLQMVFFVPQRNSIVESPIFPGEIIGSVPEFRRLLLCSLTNLVGKLDRDVIQWLQGQCLEMASIADEVRKIEETGWDLDFGYVVANNEDVMPQMKTGTIGRFTLPEFFVECPEKIIANFLDGMGKVSNESAGMIIIFREISAFFSLLGLDGLEAYMILVGREAKEVAVNLFAVCDEATPVLNVDSCKWSVIYKAAFAHRDTPLIVSCDCEKGLQNMERTKAAFLAGSIDGKCLGAPLVACFSRFPAKLDTDRALILTVDGVCMLPRCILTDFQRFTFSLVGKDVNYWRQFLQRSVHAQLEKGEERVLAAAHAVLKMLHQLFSNYDLDKDLLDKIDFVFECGEVALRELLRNAERNVLIVFRDGIIEMSSKGHILFVDRTKKMDQESREAVFYDENYYYFTHEMYRKSVKELLLDDKSGIRIKQQLANELLIKCYSNNFSKREFFVDFTIINEHGIKERKSGLAIRREFFVETAGVGLEERR